MPPSGKTSGDATTCAAILLLAFVAAGCVSDIRTNEAGPDVGHDGEPTFCPKSDEPPAVELTRSHTTTPLPTLGFPRPFPLVRAPIITTRWVLYNRVEAGALVLYRFDRRSAEIAERIAQGLDVQLLDASDNLLMYAVSSADGPPDALREVEIWLRPLPTGDPFFFATDTAQSFRRRFATHAADGAEFRLVRGHRAAYPGRAGMLYYDGAEATAVALQDFTPDLPYLGEELLVWSVGNEGARDIAYYDFGATSYRLGIGADLGGDDAFPVPLGRQIVFSRSRSLVRVSPQDGLIPGIDFLHSGPCTPPGVDEGTLVFSCLEGVQPNVRGPAGDHTIYRLGRNDLDPQPLFERLDRVVFAPRTFDGALTWFEFPSDTFERDGSRVCNEGATGTLMLARPFSGGLGAPAALQQVPAPCGDLEYRPGLEARLGSRGIGVLNRVPDGPSALGRGELVWEVGFEVWDRRCHGAPWP